MIFVDTGAWFASIFPWDRHHIRASEWLLNNTQPLFTTDYIVDETLSLLRARGEPVRSLAIGQQFFAGKLGTVHNLSTDEIHSAWSLFQSHSDKKWSFTDCTSFAIIQKLKLGTPFSFDHHFRQFGKVLVVLEQIA